MIRNVLGAVIGCMLVLASVAHAQEQRGFYIGTGYGVMKLPEVDGMDFSDAHNAYLQVGYQITNNFAIEAQYSNSTKEGSADFLIEDIDTSWEVWQSLMELNAGMTLSEAMSIFPESYADIGIRMDADVETLALYGVYRSSGKFYLKAKAGGVSAKASIKAAVSSFDFRWLEGNGNVIEGSVEPGMEGFDMMAEDFVVTESERDTEFSAGLGVGYRIDGNFMSELEYTVIDDVDYISLGINYAF
jgi:hypothetical protein